MSKVTYIELASRESQNAPADNATHVEDLVRRGHDYSSGAWKYDAAPQDKPWLSGKELFWLCAVCFVVMFCIICGYHYIVELSAEVGTDLN